MAKNTAPERPVAGVGETSNFSVSFVGALDSGELLTGTPTATEVTTSDLTIRNVAVSTAALVINDISVETGKAVQCKVIGQLKANAPYMIRITAVTDSTPAQTKIRKVIFKVEE